jgi:hypothetical protein
MLDVVDQIVVDNVEHIVVDIVDQIFVNIIDQIVTDIVVEHHIQLLVHHNVVVVVEPFAFSVLLLFLLLRYKISYFSVEKNESVDEVFLVFKH